MITSLLILAALGICLAGFLPPVVYRQGSGGLNNPYRIVMPFRSEIPPREWRGKLSQECAEWALRWLLGLPAALPAFALAVQVLPQAIAEVVALFAAMLVAGKASVIDNLNFDLTGHTAECVSDGWREDYIEAEIGRMLRDEKFAKLGRDEVRRRMEKRRWLGRVLYRIVKRRVDGIAR